MLAWVSLLRFSPWKSRSPLLAQCRRLARAVLGPEALHRGPGLDQRAVDAEVLGRHQAPDLGIGQHLGQEPGRDVAGEQPVAVLGEGGLVPGRVVDPEPDEPAEQQVEVQPLHELALRAHAVEGLQQQRPQQPLRRDRRPADAGIERGELRAQPLERRVDDLPDRPQRMIRPNPRLKIDIREQCTRTPIRPPHRRLRGIIAPIG